MNSSSTACALRNLARREAVKSKLKQTGVCETFLSNGVLRTTTRDTEAVAQCFLTASEWECIAVGLLLAKEISDSTLVSPEFLELLHGHADAHLEHPEPRVRDLVASLLGSMVKVSSDCGLAVYCRFCARLSNIVESTFERGTGKSMYQISATKQIPADDCTGWKVRIMPGYILPTPTKDERFED